MSSDESVTPLEIHTLDTLCNELVSGRGVSLRGDGRVLRLASDATRAVFDWYRRNQSKWAGQNRKEDVEALASEVTDQSPGAVPLIVSPPSRRVQLVHLKGIRVHRFAGIHHYGSVDQAPPDFELEVKTRPLPVCGSSKAATHPAKHSLLSAISWCLTGHIYRSQRPPGKDRRPG